MFLIIFSHFDLLFLAFLSLQSGFYSIPIMRMRYLAFAETDMPSASL